MRAATVAMAFLGLVLSITARSQASSSQGIPVLTPPIVLHEVHAWRDGGSLGFVIGDSLGRTIAFSVDGKIGSSTHGAVFVGVTHRDQPGAHQLPRDSEQEKQLISYLQQWLNGRFDRKQLEAVFKTTDPGQWTREQSNAFHVTQFVEQLRKRSKSE